MAVDVTTRIEIERTRSAVAPFATDPTNAPRWYANIRDVTWETQPPVAVGSRFRFRARFLGRDLDYTYEVLDLVPDERLVMATTSGPFPMETSYTWVDAPRGTAMTLRNRGEPEGYFRAVASIVSLAMGRANRADLARLKRLLEAT
jgi:uncharacterized protein YndB with AHSA1/START domain